MMREVWRKVRSSFRTHHIGDYMKRWIVKLPTGHTVRVHRILRADADDEMHNHPFAFVSLILSGGYLEQIYVCEGELHHKVQIWRRPFSLNRCSIETRHKICWVPPGGAWTLVLAQPKAQSWGFFLEPDQTFVPWREFIARSKKDRAQLEAYRREHDQIYEDQQDQ